MSLSAICFVTLTELKTYLGYPVPANPSPEDSLLESLIEAATKRAEKETNRWLQQREDHEEIVHGNGRREFLLKQWPADVQEVYVDPARDFGPETLLDADVYEPVTDHEGIVIGLERMDQLWPRGRQNIKVVYHAGYADVPEDMKHAVLMLCQFWKRRLEDKDLGIRVRNKGDENITFSTELPSLVREIFAGYKRTEFQMDEMIPSY